MPRICINCVCAPELKKLIASTGKPLKRCPNCGSLNELTVSTKSKNVKHAFRAAIRYYFSEWDYNEHWGGHGFWRLFQRENPVVLLRQNYPYPDELIFDITDPAYFDYDNGISLYAGYHDGIPNMPLTALKDDTSSFLGQCSVELQQKNYWEIEDRLVSKLKTYVGKIDKIVPSGQEFFRARIGHAGRFAQMSGDFTPNFHYKPYKGNELGAPPPQKATAGRMNRDGVSYLYLADERQTAIAEVRPHPSHKVSIGTFRNTESLRLADFSSVSFLDFKTDQKLDEDFLFLKSIDRSFSLPVTPEDKHKYTIMQAVAESLRKLKYDGVVFESTVGSGNNIASFYPEKFSYLEDSGDVVSIVKVSYGINVELLVPDDNKDEFMTR